MTQQQKIRAINLVTLGLLIPFFSVIAFTLVYVITAIIISGV